MEEIGIGRLTLALSILEKQGCRVFITAKDCENRRLWKTPLMDADGNIKVFTNYIDAIAEAKSKLLSSKRE